MVALLDVAIYSWDCLMLGGGVDLFVVALVARAKWEISRKATQSTYDSHDNGKTVLLFSKLAHITISHYQNIIV